jgi:hypothetical protein
MKIWTITTNDDDGIHTTVAYSEAAADVAERAYLISKWWGDIAALPADMEGARDAVYGQSGMLDSIHVDEHTITDHPDIAAAIASVDALDDLGNSDLAMVNDETMGAIQLAQLEVRAALTGLPDDGPAFGISPNLQDHAKSVTDAYRKAAQDQASDELEIDPDAYVAVSEDGDGAFVAAWLWVHESDAAKHLPPLPQETMQ